MRERAMTVGGDGGARLAVREFRGPPGSRALLLHHGLASSQRIWDLMLPRLTHRYRVVTFDARGHGLSGKPSSGYGFDHVVADALAVAGATRMSRPVIVGHSWGAMVALEAAARHPRRFSGAVLVDGGVVSVGSSMDWPTTKRELAPPPMDGMPLDEFLGSLHRWSPVPVTPELEAMFLSLMRVDKRGRIHRRLSVPNHLRILWQIWRQRPLELYERLSVPTLGIVARAAPREERERAFLESKRRALVQARQAAHGRPVTFVWMDGVHDLPVQRPVALAQRIERFVTDAVR